MPFLVLCVLFARAAGATPTPATPSDLRRLSIEELAQIRITSVSKVPESLQRAAGSVYVITREAIVRSGATTIPEILRLAPNLQVARLDANTYAISSRGFNQPSGAANKLLVLLDGRTVYSPLFSGTFWDAQRTMIDDIDRIEVISGPGGTLWGANAVNGIINIITRSAEETQGWLADARLGTIDRRMGIRRGGELGSASFRIYGLAIAQGAMDRSDGSSAADAWNLMQGGFRSDWRNASDTFTLQGDIQRGTGIGRPAVLTSGSLEGSNLAGSWSRALAGESRFGIHAFADHTRRRLVSGIDATVNQYSIEAQYDTVVGGRHALVLGSGLRVTDDRFERGPGTAFLDPAEKTLRFANVFAQDRISLAEHLQLTLGVKAEHNSYTGLELMPDARLMWSMSDRAAVWSSVSRAVRTPSRFDSELVNTGILTGSDAFRSETLVAWEAGFRAVPSPRLSFSVSAFYNDYDELRTVEASGPAVFPLVIRNGMRGTTHGLEVWGDFAIREWWRVSAGLSVFEKDLEIAPGSADLFGVSFAGNDPEHQWQVRTSIDLPSDLALDLWLRGVSALPNPAVPAYREADVRLGWTASDSLTLALVGQNLLHERHLEFVNPSIPANEVPRSLTLTARWTR